MLFGMLLLLGTSFAAYAQAKPVDGVAPMPSQETKRNDGNSLSLEKAIQKTLEANGYLQAKEFEIQALKAEAHQAGLRTNPELEVEIEEFAGRGERRGLEGSEAAVLLSQSLQLGGKRQKSRRLANLETHLAQMDRDKLRTDLVAQVSGAFNQVLAAQDRLALMEELVNLSQQTHNTVSARVEAGKVSPLEATKSKVALATAEIHQNQAILALSSARQRLVSFWGGAPESATPLVGHLEILPVLPSLKTLLPHLDQHPQVQLLALQKKREQAALDLEKANAIGDLTFKGGLQRFQDTDDHALVFSVAMPLNLFNRNKGRISAASSRIRVADYRQQAVKAEKTADLSEAYQALKATHMSAQALQQDILPAAQWAFEAASEGYREGKFGFLEVLDAQRTLFQTKVELNAVMATYAAQKVEVERLAGRRLEEAGQEASDEN